MEQRIRDALAIDERSTAEERTVDITTTGARTGQPRRIEIWFHRVDGRYYLSSFPARPGWYANLRANPRFTVHLKRGVTADLAATAVPVSEARTIVQMREAGFRGFLIGESFMKQADPAAAFGQFVRELNDCCDQII